jgi:hypothetical protein
LDLHDEDETDSTSQTTGQEEGHPFSISSSHFTPQLWLKLSGNQIRIQKGAEGDAKVHLLGTLSRHTTSIRPINSPDLGRDALLLEGVQIPLDEGGKILLEDDDDAVFEEGHHSDTSIPTITIELGFENGQEAERWLRATQDIIN